MATITFKAKVQNAMTMMPGEVAFRLIQVPELQRRHCDMASFRRHAIYGGIANSSLFPSALARIKRDITKTGGWIRLDQLPDNVTVDESDFLATVTITI